MLPFDHMVQVNDPIYTLYDYSLVGNKQVVVALDSNSDWRVWIKILGFHHTPSEYCHFFLIFYFLDACKF